MGNPLEESLLDHKQSQPQPLLEKSQEFNAFTQNQELLLETVVMLM